MATSDTSVSVYLLCYTRKGAEIFPARRTGYAAPNTSVATSCSIMVSETFPICGARHLQVHARQTGPYNQRPGSTMRIKDARRRGRMGSEHIRLSSSLT